VGQETDCGNQQERNGTGHPNRDRFWTAGTEVSGVPSVLQAGGRNVSAHREPGAKASGEHQAPSGSTSGKTEEKAEGLMEDFPFLLLATLCFFGAVTTIDDAVYGIPSARRMYFLSVFGLVLSVVAMLWR
jgi:hypothetical protein